MAMTPAQVAALATVSAELQFMWSEREVPAELQATLATQGIKTLGVFGSIVDTREQLRDTLKLMLDIDPSEAGIAADIMIQRRVNLARIIDSWETARKRISERDRISAEQRASRLPITLERGQHVMLRQKFEAEHGRLKDHAFPCHAMVERRMEEIDEGEPKAELLSDVISVEEAVEDVVGAVIDKKGTWKTKKTTKSVALPTTSETAEEQAAPARRLLHDREVQALHPPVALNYFAYSLERLLRLDPGRRDCRL